MGTNPSHDSDQPRQANPTIKDVINLALGSLGNSREAILHYLETKNVPLDTPVRYTSANQGAAWPVMETIRQALEDVFGEGHLIMMQLIVNATTEINSSRAGEAE